MFFFLFNHFPDLISKGREIPTYLCIFVVVAQKVGVTVHPFSPVSLIQCKMQRS